MIHEIRSLVIENLITELPHISSSWIFLWWLCCSELPHISSSWIFLWWLCCSVKVQFRNLYLHQKDFKVVASWGYFATSHGKSPCDGIGETVKCAVTKESLQKPTDQKIISCVHMFNFCQSFFSHIMFCFFSSPQREWRLLENWYLIILKNWNLSLE